MIDPSDADEMRLVAFYEGNDPEVLHRAHEIRKKEIDLNKDKKNFNKKVMVVNMFHVLPIPNKIPERFHSPHHVQAFVHDMSGEEGNKGLVKGYSTKNAVGSATVKVR